jgi:hypothetical protein
VRGTRGKEIEKAGGRGRERKERRVREGETEGR